MKYGYVKINRKIMDKCYYNKSEFIHLLLHLKLKASFKDNEFLLGDKIIKLKAGQFVTGREKLSSETGISESKIERILKVLVNDGEIEQQTNSRNRIITILSKVSDIEVEQQTDSKTTTDGQQLNNKPTADGHNQESIIKYNKEDNVNNDNLLLLKEAKIDLPVSENLTTLKTETTKEKKNIGRKRKEIVFVPPTCQEVERYFIDNSYKKEVGTKAWKFYDAGDWHDSKGHKVKNWKQKMQNWFTDENLNVNIKPLPQQVGDNAIDTILNG